MKLYALVGKSGTGKSYKAMSLARELNIEYLIDDGILIAGQRKIIGQSAKREKTKVAAVKRAIFFHEHHRLEMKDKIDEINPESLLIVGTSLKMVKQIADNLQISPIDEIINIEDISTKEEIETAKFHRMHYGKHVIPLPTLEVKKDFSGYLLDPLRIFSRVFGRKDTVLEKSVVRPTFSYIGQFTISNKTLIQIANISMSGVKGFSRHTKIKVVKKPTGLTIELEIIVKYGFNVHTVGYNTIEAVKHDLEKMTQMSVEKIELHVKAVDY